MRQLVHFTLPGSLSDPEAATLQCTENYADGYSKFAWSIIDIVEKAQFEGIEVD